LVFFSSLKATRNSDTINKLLLNNDSYGEIVWHQTAMNGDIKPLGAHWVCGREVQGNLKDDLLLSKCRKGLTAWDIAALSGKKEVLETLWFWGREVQVNLKVDLLLATGCGLTA